MVGWGHGKGKDSQTGGGASSMADRMTDYLMEMRRQRQAQIEAKLKAGYRPRLDAKGNVVLVKVEATTEEAE